jgi:hypothetical protein
MKEARSPVVVLSRGYPRCIHRMQIREQGDIVKLIRAEQVPGWPRARPKVVGTFRRSQVPPAALLALLAEDERNALARWLSVQQEREAQTRYRQTLAAAPLCLAGIATALDAAPQHVTSAEAASIWHRLAEVANALERAGYPGQPDSREVRDVANAPDCTRTPR